MDSEDEDAQMRQMMGFSSFGNKKRKPNAGSKVANDSATSSNSTPLGKRSTMTKDPLSLVPASLPPRPPPSTSTADSAVQNSELSTAKLPEASPMELEITESADHSSEQTPVEITTSFQQRTTNLTNTAMSPSVFNAQAAAFEPTPADQRSTSNSIYSKNDIRSDSTYWASRHERQENDEAIGYKSPWTGIELTVKDLRDYGNGKPETQPNGKVEFTFFKPSFVEEGIWDRWEKKV